MITASLRRNGKPSGLADELIAGHAMSLGMPGLKVESWL
jgi:predicted nucleic acid-binding protein